MKTLNAIKADLSQHYGSETFTRHAILKNCIASEGAMDYFEQAECFWLWDIIATECHAIIMELEPDVHYFKIVSKDGQADLTLDNYEDTRLWDRHIGFTTHPEGEMELVVGWDGSRTTICLHSEN